jgi:uncharacterized protein YoxC
MNDVPAWMITTWFWLSSIFFLLGIIVLVGIFVAGLKVLQMLTELKPKIDALDQNVQGLLVKVHSVADRVEELTVSVKATVDNVGGRARGVAGSAELVAQVASRQFERFSPWLIGTITAMRLVNEWRAEHAKAKGGKPQSKLKKASSFGQSVVRALVHLAGK